MSESFDFGQIGEEMATNYLIKKGYTILERNWRFQKKEIDIIAKQKDTIAIVEVKTRSNEHFELPQEAVTKNKQKNVIKAADIYIQEKEIDLEARFDIITVLKVKNGFEIDHIKDAFAPNLLF